MDPNDVHWEAIEKVGLGVAILVVVNTVLLLGVLFQLYRTRIQRDFEERKFDLERMFYATKRAMLQIAENTRDKQ